MRKKFLLLGSMLVVIGMLVFPMGVMAASHAPNGNGNPPNKKAPTLTVDTAVPPSASYGNTEKSNNGNHNGSDKGNKNDQVKGNSNSEKLHGSVMVYKGVIASITPAETTDQNPPASSPQVATTLGTLTLTLADGSTVDLTVTDQTQVKIPTLKNATMDDLAVGETVVVQTRTDADGNTVVVKILLVPGKPISVHRVGTVTDYVAPVAAIETTDATDGSITIMAQDGMEYTFTVTSDTKLLPTGTTEVNVGDMVTIIAPRNPATPTEQLTAMGIVVHMPDTGDTTTSSDTGGTD